MTLAEALGVDAGDVVAFIGAGGKTTAMFRVAGDLAARGLRVIVTTTTKIFPPEPSDIELIVEEGSGDALASGVTAALGRRHVVVVVARKLPDGKLQGVHLEDIGTLRRISNVTAVLVEADGSARKPFKAPAEHEPVIPRETTLLVAVVGAEALNQPLSVELVHRPERAAEQAGITMGDRVTPHVAARIIFGQGNLRGRPAGARLAALITQVTTAARREAAVELAHLLHAGGACPVVLAELVAEPRFIECAS